MSKAKIESEKKLLPPVPWRSTSQPGIDPNAIRYGSRTVPTITVTMKASGKKLVINASDFDPDLHQKVG